MLALPDRSKLHSLVDGLQAGLLERDAPVRLSLLALLAGEHVLLLGPPGSAKSALARRLHGALAYEPGDVYFERLLTRFSTPEELFGPLSLKALEDDRYERLVEGYMPTASVAFLDEVFKANSAILNALLGLLNERVFDNGRERIAVPLVSVVGASNEVPADEALRAFYDRFLLRVPVAAVSDASFAQLLTLREEPAGAGPALSAADRKAVISAAQQVMLSDAALQSLADLRQWLATTDIDAPSDRRWRQLARLMRIEAASEGRSQADELDLWLAPYVVAALPEQVPAIAEWFTREVVRAPACDVEWATRAVQAFEQQLDIEIQTPADDVGAVAAVSGDAGKLATARNLGGGADAQGDPLASMRMVSAALQERQRKRYGQLHIDTRVAQVQAIAEQTAAALAELSKARETLNARLSQRLWWPPSVVHAVLAGPDKTLAALRELHARLLQCAAGFAALPLETRVEASAPAPAPVTV